MAMEATAAEQAVSNIPEFTVSELSFVLKREIETAFPRVRVRGEISQPSFPRSGHCYFRLKDENAVLDGVCWKTAARSSRRRACSTPRASVRCLSCRRWWAS